jgi:hypothetical protein
MNQQDLTEFLSAWPHEPGRMNVRRITGADGVEKIQIRIDLGVLQMETTGRPDGVRPHDVESLLEYHRDRRDRYIRESGSSTGFILSPDDCRALREEAVQYYHRYVANHALGDYAAVIADTTRNLEVFDLCRLHGAQEFDRMLLDQFRPHVITMRTRAEAELAMGDKEPKAAVAALDAGLRELREVFHESGRDDIFDQSGDVQLLQGMRDALVPRLPASQRAELKERLRAAIDAENYELAAILRDELRMLRE